ncbi:unnamed protein product [Brassica oleracea]
MPTPLEASELSVCSRSTPKPFQLHPPPPPHKGGGLLFSGGRSDRADKKSGTELPSCSIWRSCGCGWSSWGRVSGMASSCLLRSFNLREEGTDISPDRFNSCLCRTHLDTARVHAFIASFST